MRATPLRRKLGLSLLAVLLALLCLELVLRFTFAEAVPLRPRRFFVQVPDLQPVRMPGLPLLNGTGTSDPRIRLEFPPNLWFQLRYDAGEERTHPYMRYEDQWFVLDVKTNAAGMRGPMAQATKSAGTPRVICVGDSLTFGDGVLEEDTWTSQLSTAYRGAGGRTSR